MKRFLLLLVCTLYIALPLRATHIIGGSIWYESLGNDQYHIFLEVLRDCQNGDPNTYFDDPVPVGIFDEQGNRFTTLAMSFQGIDDTISIKQSNNICDFSDEVCVHKTLYDTIISMPSNGIYTIAYQRCCRSNAISNLENPIETGMTLHTTINTTINNSSPLFNSDFPFAVFVNSPFLYNASATDPDGDSLVYRLSYPFRGSAPNNPAAPAIAPPYDSIPFISPTYSRDNMLGGNYPLTMNDTSGEMSAIPTFLGLFQIAYAVDEYRAGQLIGTTHREFTFVVKNPLPNQNYDLEGQVLVGDSLLLDSGIVRILERDIQTDSFTVIATQAIDSSGYSFEDLPPGLFYIQAAPTSNSIYFDRFLPSYYPSLPFWYNAIPIDQCDTSRVNRDIYLVRVDSLKGEKVLEGYVERAGGGEAVANLPLLLMNDQREPLQLRLTDENGYFRFEQLPPDSYYLYVDLINSDIDNTFAPLIALNQNTTLQLSLHRDSISIESTTSIAPAVPLPQLHLYPNPTTQYLQLEWQSASPHSTSLQLYSPLGRPLPHYSRQLLLPAGIFRQTIDLRGLPSGIYSLQVKSAAGSKIHRVIKH